MTKSEIKKRKTWINIFSCLGFLYDRKNESFVWVHNAKDLIFVDFLLFSLPLLRLRLYSFHWFSYRWLFQKKSLNVHTSLRLPLNYVIRWFSVMVLWMRQLTWNSRRIMIHLEIRASCSGVVSYRDIFATRRICHYTCDFLVQTCTKEFELCRWDMEVFFIWWRQAKRVFPWNIARFSRSIIKVVGNVGGGIGSVLRGNRSCQWVMQSLTIQDSNRDVMIAKFGRKIIDLWLLTVRIFKCRDGFISILESWISIS